MGSQTIDSLESLVLREAEDKDTEQLYRLFVSSRDDLDLTFPDWDLAQKDTFFRIQFRARQDQYRSNYPEVRYQVIVFIDEIIGQLVTASGDNEIHILDISLFPEFRNRGIGTRLLRDLLDRGACLGRRLDLHVRVDNPAYQLYRRLGFVESGGDEVFSHMTWSPSHD